MVRGQHHHVSPKYLKWYANHAAWLEDHRRLDNGTLVMQTLRNAMDAPVSRELQGIGSAECTESLNLRCYVLSIRLGEQAKNMTHKLKPRADKIVETIIFLIARTDKKKKVSTQYDIVKTIWFADTWHLEKYGRPVTFDNYVAMENGPVPSKTYDILKDKEYHDTLWSVTPYTGKANSYHDAQRQFNTEKLSESELKELTEAQDLVWSLGFGNTKDVTHTHPAYKRAWVADHPGQKSFPMDYVLLVDGDEELYQDLVFASSHN